jgi:hypothetical protein
MDAPTALVALKVSTKLLKLFSIGVPSLQNTKDRQIAGERCDFIKEGDYHHDSLV